MGIVASIKNWRNRVVLSSIMLLLAVANLNALYGHQFSNYISLTTLPFSCLNRSMAATILGRSIKPGCHPYTPITLPQNCVFSPIQELL